MGNGGVPIFDWGMGNEFGEWGMRFWEWEDCVGNGTDPILGW